MFDRNGRLHIFENFVIDQSLPKHQRKQPYPAGTSVITVTGNFNTSFLQMSEVVVASSPRRLSGALWAAFWDWIWNRTRMPIDSFFKSIKNGVEELEVVETRLGSYLAAIAQAKKNGQTALAERLETNIEGVRTETQLVALKLTKFITEEQLVRFVRKAKKGLRLDWIKNFTRMVPETVIRWKEKADDRCVFDNYVVLHFDPEAKSWEETAKEKELRKDPILFGVLRGRRRLYFIGDWVDEFCDLTLDQLADVLGEPPKVIARDFETKEEYPGDTAKVSL